MIVLALAVALPAIAYWMTLNAFAVVQQNQFALFFAAVVILAWWGGLTAGALATASSLFFIARLVELPPTAPNTFAHEAFRLTLFGALGLLTTCLAELRRRDQDRLRLSEETFELFLENAREYAIFFLDLAGRVTSWNAGAQRILGYTASQIVGKSASAIFTPEDLAAREDQKEQAVARAGGRAADERWHVRADGSRFWASGMLFALRDRRGHLRGYFKIMRDQTEKKRAEEAMRHSHDQLERRVDVKTRELRHSQEQVQQLQKLDAIGRLAGGVAHDFNNLVTAILGTAETLKDGLSPNDPRQSEVHEIIDSANRAGALTRQLLAFSRRQMATPVVLDLNRLITDLDRIFHRLVGDTIEIEICLDPAGAPVHADASQIEQILINLVVNARDAMPQGGPIQIATEQAELDEAGVRRFGNLAAGRYIRLLVIDRGSGMDSATMARIFEPFFSTKGMHGTGLGLSTVFGIVQQNGGGITVQSEVGKGSRFEVLWPMAVGRDRGVPAATPRSAVTPPVSQTTVLVAEDEPIVRRVVCRSLSKRGYRVLEAGDGDEALRLCEKHNDPIDLLITDVIMPGLNGKQLAERATKIHPKMKVLFTSGYTSDIIASRGLLTPDTAFIEKSFTADALAAKVQEVLSGNASRAAPL